MSAVLLIVGAPGSGKSSLVNAMTDTLAYSIEKKPFWHTVYYDEHNTMFGAQFGWTPEYGPGKQFPGTDRLAFDVIPKATAFMKSRPYPYIVAEGDRLSHDRFIIGSMNAGYKVEIAVVTVPPPILNERLADRQQNGAWVKSRESHIQELIDSFTPWIVAKIPGTIDHAEQLRQLAEVSDVAKAFLEA